MIQWFLPYGNAAQIVEPLYHKNISEFSLNKKKQMCCWQPLGKELSCQFSQSVTSQYLKNVCDIFSERRECGLSGCVKGPLCHVFLVYNPPLAQIIKSECKSAMFLRFSEIYLRNIWKFL